jgi:outer membrane murein-binding lipoprotein Lpp
VAIDLYEALKAAGVPEDKARASAKAIEEASRVNTKLSVLMWIGGLLAGGTIAGFASVVTQLIRLTGDVTGLTSEVSHLASEVASLAEIVRSMTPGR